MSLPPKPEPTVVDHARVVGDAAVAAVPVVGGALGVLLGEVIKPGYQKRLDSWLGDLGDVVRRLEDDIADFDLGALEANELFVSAVVHSTQIALGTSLEAKIEMLKAGLINIANGELSDDFLAMRFLAFVEELAPEHFFVLAYAVDPAPWHAVWGETNASTPRALIDASGLKIRLSIVDLIIADLSTRSLIDTSSLDRTSAGVGALAGFATPLGRQLVQFVEVF